MDLAGELLDVAMNEWLREKRASSNWSTSNAAHCKASGERQARLRVLVSRAERIHEIDAQIELLLTLPTREAKHVQPLIEDLRRVRNRIARDKAGS